MRKPTTPREDLLRGIWRENPVLIQMLGLCPALAVTNSVMNSLAMAGAVFFVLICSSLLVSLIKKLVPNEVRISTFILVIATFVTIADMSLEALAPAVHKELGAFVALIVVNCIILGRQEAFASKKPVGRSVLDALGTSIGFAIALLMMGSVREILGNGTLLKDTPWAVHVFGSNFEPWVIFVLPPGGFLTLGFWLLGLSWWAKRRQRRAAAGPEAAAEGRAA